MSNALAKQIGPLPLGVWLGVGAGGLALAYFINKRMAVNAATASKEPSTTQLTESGVGLGGGQMIYNPPVTGSADATPENNSSWGIKATNWLVSKGIVATDADQAIRKYLSSLPLSATERGMVNLVIGQFGVPPEPLPPTEGVDPETGRRRDVRPLPLVHRARRLPGRVLLRVGGGRDLPGAPRRRSPIDRILRFDGCPPMPGPGR